MTHATKKKLDFKGKNIFVGIDVHKNSWKVTIRSAFLELQTFSANPSPQELLAHLRKRYPGACYHTAYEAGFCGFWIHREFLKEGIDSIVVHATDIPRK